MMKKLIGLLMVLCMMPFAFAQTDVAAGMTPDSPFYGLDVWWDNMRLSRATGEEKSRLALEIAEERASEMEAMIIQNKEQARVRAEQEHQKQLQNFENAEKGLNDEQRVRMQVRFERHSQNMERVMAQVPEQARESIKASIQNMEQIQTRVESRVSAENKVSARDVELQAQQIRITEMIETTTQTQAGTCATGSNCAQTTTSTSTQSRTIGR